LLQNYLRGTDLGVRLSISNSIIEDNGGKMLVQNNADGKETTFSFSLPLS
jgi:signal transduction histidine kinase